ncbi:MAG: zf-HC2 domain-containing protein [Actinobacteria bacterium]|nr:zf-HC2 domain-containing protein [Actinomycetota bacterium]
MSCDEVREQLAEHLLGTLEGPEDLAVRRHLRGCASCRREMAALAEGVSTFARAAHEVSPPEALRERVLTVLEREWADSASLRSARRPTVWLARAAAVAAVAGSLAWGFVANHRAASYELAAGKYQDFLEALGGENVRVGVLRPSGPQALEGSVVVYDSKADQSWVLVLVRAPGLQGEAGVILSSPTGATIEMHALEFSQGGEASSWLVTSWNLQRFDRVMVTDPAGVLLATGTVSRE